MQCFSRTSFRPFKVSDPSQTNNALVRAELHLEKLNLEAVNKIKPLFLLDSTDINLYFINIFRTDEKERIASTPHFLVDRYIQVITIENPYSICTFFIPRS